MRQIVGAGLLLLGLSTASADGTAPCVTLTESQRASIPLVKQGVEAINRRDYEAAMAALNEATLADRASPVAWENLGTAYWALKRYRDAAYAYEHAVALVGDDATYRYEHGRALFKAATDGMDGYALFTGDELAPALAELEEALALEPRLFRAAFYVGKIHRHQREWAAAATAFTRAIQLGFPEPDAYIALGELYRRWDYTDEAIKVLAQGVAQVHGEADQEAELRFALGMAYLDKQDYGKAILAFDEAIAKNTDLAKARYARGIARFQHGDLDDARVDFEAYVKLAPDDLTREIAHEYLLELDARTP